MGLKEEIANSKKLIHRLNDRIAQLAFNDDGMLTRHNLAMRCLDIAYSRYRSIVLLVEHGHYGSAYALVRVFSEAYMKGIWLWNCASDEVIEKFHQTKGGKKYGKPFKQLVEDVWKTIDHMSPMASYYYSWYSFMSSFPHTGNTLLSIPNSEKDEDLIAELLPGLDKIAQECVVPSMEDIAKFNKPVGPLTGVRSLTSTESSKKPKSLFGIDKGRIEILDDIIKPLDVE